jgi:hypothetical protein
MLTLSSDAGGDLIGEAPATIAAPLITAQPVDQLVSAGDFASFSVVVAVTSGVTFQWAFNGTAIAGAIHDSLLLAAAAAADVGNYSVTVTNSAGTVTSSPATLTLDSGAGSPSPPLRLTAYADPNVGAATVTVIPLQRGYTQGEQVTLQVSNVTVGATFIGWFSAGNLIATTNPVTVTITADMTVRARLAVPVRLPDGLVSWWRGEPTTSAVVLDSIDDNNGGFFTGSTPTPAPPSYTPTGKVGGAFAFDGTNYVQIPDAPNLQPSQITLEAWVFPTVLSSTSNQTVIGRGSSTDGTEQWRLGVLNGISQFFSSPPPSVGSWPPLAAPAAIPLNEWTHLAATLDGATQVLYVNGRQVAAQSFPFAIFYTPVPVGIGATWQNNTPTDLFNGVIDEVSIYDRALTCDEIFDIYNADLAGKNATAPYFTTDSQLFAINTNGTVYSQQLTTVLGTAPASFSLSDGALPPGMTLSPDGAVTGALTLPGVFDFTVTATDASGNSTEQLYVLTVLPPVHLPPPGLVSWWRGESTTSAVVLDSIDNNNGGFFTGSTPTPAPPSYTPTGKVGGAFAFDGTNYVQIPDAPNLQPSQITLEAWVFPTVWSTSFQTVIGRGSPNATGDQWWLGVRNGTPQFFIDFEGIGEALAAPTTIPLGEWTHLAATFDGATKVLYVNGIQVAAQANSNAIFYESVPVGIGAHRQGNIVADLFTGFIDEVSLYDRALTPAEIYAIVTAGAAGK